jgi:hypothetical protein
MRQRGAHFYWGLTLLLGTGAPLGWLALQALRGQLPGGGVGAELRQGALLYAYLWLGTTLALGALGATAWSSRRPRRSDLSLTRTGVRVAGDQRKWQVPRGRGLPMRLGARARPAPAGAAPTRPSISLCHG